MVFQTVCLDGLKTRPTKKLTLCAVPTTNCPFTIDVFHGQLSPNVAQVYARVDTLPGGGPWTLTGVVRGPECLHAKTLPTTVPLADLGSGPTLLAKATLADPCFWSMELPALYRMRLELRERDRLIATDERQVGFRFLGVSGRSFYWRGERWVLRGVHRGAVNDCPLSDWRSSETAMIVERPDEALCRDASREGVVLVAKVATDEQDLAAELHRLARWPSVTLALIELTSNQAIPNRDAAPNLMLGCGPLARVAFIPDWAEVVVVEANALPVTVPRQITRPMALIACRQAANGLSLGEARAQCDVLQRDLATLGDFAGYLV